MELRNDLKISYIEAIEQHRRWLQHFDKQRLGKWENLLNADPEAAICEAETVELLLNYDVEVQPYENLSKGGPDFLCTKKGRNFYVEVTCITIDIATKKSALPPSYPAQPSPQYYRFLTNHILGELCNKTRQCSELGQPCIIAIATLHHRAGACCFRKSACEDILTGTSQATVDINVKEGRAEGEPYLTTELRDSAFIRFAKTADGTIEYARNPISALLLCAFGQYPIMVNGVLHPNSNYPFDREMLLGIEFCMLESGCEKNRHLKVKWI
ncbi:MAG: hypothetical protein LLF92_01895 [Planctomycetaceae bacterium]|nr:hypothetical protein [Planctomycetaceae bacterium]